MKIIFENMTRHININLIKTKDLDGIYKIISEIIDHYKYIDILFNGNKLKQDDIINLTDDDIFEVNKNTFNEEIILENLVSNEKCDILEQLFKSGFKLDIDNKQACKLFDIANKKYNNELISILINNGLLKCMDDKVVNSFLIRLLNVSYKLVKKYKK